MIVSTLRKFPFLITASEDLLIGDTALLMNFGESRTSSRNSTKVILRYLYLCFTVQVENIFEAMIEHYRE